MNVRGLEDRVLEMGRDDLDVVEFDLGVFDLDEVIFVPTGAPWQKADRDVSPAEDRYLMSRDELMNRMAVLLGGRAAFVYWHH